MYMLLDRREQTFAKNRVASGGGALSQLCPLLWRVEEVEVKGAFTRGQCWLLAKTFSLSLSFQFSYPVEYVRIKKC